MESTVLNPATTEHAASEAPNLGGLIGLFQAELGNDTPMPFNLGAFISAPTSVTINYPDTIQVEQPIIIDDVEEAPITTAEMLLMMESGDDFYSADFTALLDDNHSFSESAAPSTADGHAIADALDFDWVTSAGEMQEATDGGYDHHLAEAGAIDTMPELDMLDEYDEAALSFESTDSFIFFDHDA